MTQEVLARNNYVSALQKRSEEAFLNHNRLFAEKEKQLQSLRTRLDQLKFELENKEKELEFEIEKKIEFDHVCELPFWKATLRQVEYELRMKTEELDVAEANITSLGNLLKELHTEKDIVEQENQQLQYELYKRTQEFLAKNNYVSALQKRSEQASLNYRANTDVVRKLFGESLIKQGVLVEENQSLKSQFQSYDNKLKQLEYEVEIETKANIVDLKEDLEDDILEYDQFP
ncbi:hypothetical protein GBA52_016521 [Prunus armeniaca]|nr:hypothetical protein GBA52_016521 [Prunus armeniaca]